ncbi:hypothetical protein [Ruminococcus flavefaciens]|uniref:hypothetical protein n=1 Tax=Ruminococcus flavefaciens TaxID=1265 RepID=UPI00049111DB|nr:hypothetical protein [Ruminococcus flavefaciens]
MRNRIALHAEQRKTIITSLAFSLISFFLMLILILSVNKDAIRLNSLLLSDYDYSVTMQDTVQKDDYYQFNAGIEFTLSANANTSLNADIVMQSKDSLYTDMVSWNAEPLGTNGVAVSENVAKSNNLHIGDKLYSKHIVNGESCEYVIEQLLPEAVGIMATNGMDHSDGIIIMGYDERYIENITHSSILFTKDPINELSAIGSLENIVYRDDEIMLSLRSIIPYLVVLSIVSIVTSVAFTILLTKSVSSNFRRLIILGFDRKQLNKAYYRLVRGTGIISIIASFAFSGIVFLFVNYNAVKLLILLLIPFIEIITLLIASNISNKRLWRK